MANTTAFTLTMGVNPGYSHNNLIGTLGLRETWQEEALKVFLDCGIYVSGSIVDGTTVYHTEWGCPVGGEITSVINGVRNDEFLKDDEAWREAVRRVATSVGRKFGQKTLYLTFAPVDFEYIVDP